MFYTAETTGAAFVLTKALMDQQGAEGRCNELGGHLAAFTSRLEQREVEAALQDAVRAGRHCCRAALMRMATNCCVTDAHDS